LKTVSELPAELRSLPVNALAARETIRTIIVFPPQIQRGWHYVPKQALLFTGTGMTHLLASIWPGEQPQVTSLQGCDLLYMRVTLMLLYGFLEVVAKGEDHPVQLAVEFNTLNWYCLWSPLQQFLRATQDPHTLPCNQEADSLITQQVLKTLPVKFSNGLELYGLLPGEVLEEAVFQAGTWKRWLYVFQKPVLANTLVMLTSHYMVVIREDVDVKQGWIISYIPRNSIVGIQNQPCGLWNELSVRLKQGRQSVDYKLALKNEAVETWHARWAQHGGQWEDLFQQQA
jgi:hypothetical protein